MIDQEIDKHSSMPIDPAMLHARVGGVKIIMIITKALLWTRVEPYRSIVTSIKYNTIKIQQ